MDGVNSRCKMFSDSKMNLKDWFDSGRERWKSLNGIGIYTIIFC
jgi:hypothetical protein